MVKRRVSVSSVGADIFVPYLQRAKQSNIFEHLVRCDVRFLPFRSKSVHIVVCSQVIEHLPKVDGMVLLAELERISLVQVVVGTPVGFLEKPLSAHGSVQMNPFEKHKSGWAPCELASMGYLVRGQGLGLVYRDGGIAHKWPFLMALLAMISYLFAPVLYFLPSAAAQMICTKSPRNARECAQI